MPGGLPYIPPMCARRSECNVALGTADRHSAASGGLRGPYAGRSSTDGDVMDANLMGCFIGGSEQRKSGSKVPMC